LYFKFISQTHDKKQKIQVTEMRTTHR